MAFPLSQTHQQDAADMLPVLIEGGGTAGGQGIVGHDGQRDFRAVATCPAPTTLRLEAAASSRDSRARLSVLRRLPRPISYRASMAPASKGH